MSIKWSLLCLVFFSTQIGAKVTRVVISQSFFADGKKAELTESTIYTIVHALSWRINFKTLQKNDVFIITGSQKNLPDAITFKRKRQQIHAFLWQGEYYDQNGKNIRTGFLKAPLAYKRISSYFKLRRFHPILKTWRAHRAVDYAAPKGTQVFAIADGIVQKNHYIGALGNAIFIQHSGDYQSVYAHLYKFARHLRAGKRVKKGQLIGFVGSTGRSTGAHLHFEIRYQGKRIDPLNFNLPKYPPLRGKQLKQFNQHIRTL
jgi:murein DD-endopeptidase MepM/ murein hydrolase activator NlpD